MATRTAAVIPRLSTMDRFSGTDLIPVIHSLSTLWGQSNVTRLAAETLFGWSDRLPD